MKINVKINNKTFSVNIDDLHARPIQAEVDGEVFEVWPEAVAASSQPQISVTSAPHPSPPKVQNETNQKGAMQSGSNTILAPIPGVIVEIPVKSGQKVKYGQELCVLEAMKMKNSIRAGRDGTIKEVCVSVGDHVAQSQILVELEKGEK